MHAWIPVETPHRMTVGLKFLTAPIPHPRLLNQPPTSKTLDRPGLMSHLQQQGQ